MMQLVNKKKLDDHLKKLSSVELCQFYKDRADFLENFYQQMYELGLVNKMEFTAKLDIKYPTNYGFFGILYQSPGVCFSDIKTNIGKVQEQCFCIWIMKTKPFQRYAEVQIVTKPIDEHTLFTNPGVKPYEMFIGLDFSLNPIIVDLNKHCQILLAGATGSGKTRLQWMILLAWILSCTPNEIEIYLSDLLKDGFAAFEYEKHVKYYATEYDEMLKMLKYLEHRIEKRRKIIRPLRAKGLATNIEEYNKISEHKMSYIILMNDEFPGIVPDSSDSKEEKAVKQECLDIIKRLSKVGREMGVFVINGVQKTVKDELPSIIKSMSAVRISLRANDEISSQVIMGDNSAVGLADRYAVYSLNGGEQKDYLFMPELTTNKLNELLKPYVDYKRKKPSLDINEAVETEPAKVYLIPKRGPEKAEKGNAATPYEAINSKKGYEVVND